MRSETGWRKGKRPGWPIAIILVLVLLASVLLSVQADSLPREMGANDALQGQAGTGPAAALSPESKTARVYVPMVIQHTQPPASVFGVEMFSPSPDQLAQAKEAGAYWVRLAAFRWDQIQPSFSDPPKYKWSAVDEEVLKNVHAYGMKAIAIVKFTPPWAQKVPGSTCGPIKQVALDDFGAFLYEAVRRYSGPPYNVRYWELGNEPDADPSVVPPDNPWGCWGDMKDEYYGGGYYAEMLKVAYPAIKTADPNAQVLIGGLLVDCDPENPPPGKNCHESRFLEGILRNGGGPYFDIAAFHVYSYWGYGLGKFNNASWPGSVTVVPEKTAYVRGVLERYGFGGKPLMNTEGAMLCREAVDLCFESQAYFVPRAYAEAIALGLEAQSWYALPSTGWWNSGLLRSDRSPKPAYRAYQAASSFLKTAQYLGQASGYPPGVEGYFFRQKDTGTKVDVIWSVDWSLRRVTLAPGSLAYDPYGELIASSGAISIERSPVYVVRP